jgi:malonyl CoA-acyl carrier protein transacylase
MASAQSVLDDALDAIEWGETEQVIIANVDGVAHSSADDWRPLLSRQLTSPVQFLDATLALPSAVTTSVEMPPAGVLTGLTKRIRNFDRQVVAASPLDLQEASL